MAGLKHHPFSATTAARALLCGPSLAGKRGELLLAEEPDEVGEFGKRFHRLVERCLAGDHAEPRTADEEILLQRAIAWMARRELAPEHFEGAEIALEAGDCDDCGVRPLGARTLTGGILDALWLWRRDRRAHIVDWKTSYVIRERLVSWQLRIYAFLAVIVYDLEEVTVSAYYVRLGQERTLTLSREEALSIEEQLERAREDFEEGIRLAFQPGYEQCSFCPRRADCPALGREVIRAGAADVARMEDLTRILELAPVIEERIAAAKETAKTILQLDPKALPGWKLKETRGDRELTDLREAHARLVGGEVLTGEEFLECLRPSIGTLEDKAARALKAQGRAKTLKEGKQVFESRLEGILGRAPAHFRLTRITEEDQTDASS